MIRCEYFLWHRLQAKVIHKILSTTVIVIIIMNLNKELNWIELKVYALKKRIARLFCSQWTKWRIVEKNDRQQSMSHKEKLRVIFSYVAQIDALTRWQKAFDVMLLLLSAKYDSDPKRVHLKRQTKTNTKTKDLLATENHIKYIKTKEMDQCSTWMSWMCLNVVRFFLVLMLLSLDTVSVTVTNHIENYEKTRRRPEANKKGTKTNKWNLSFGDYYWTFSLTPRLLIGIAERNEYESKSMNRK